LLVEIRLTRSDLDGAGTALGALDELVARTADERAAAFADLAAGRLGAVRGDERASAPFQAAIERFGALQLPFEAARARLELAKAIAATAPAAAAAEARVAARDFERLGAARHADAAAALLRRLGAAGGRTWPKGSGELTKREREVLALLGEGLSNAEIAERLVISRRTAEHHVANVLSKLGLRSRAEAAAHAVREQPTRPVAG
jgi:DNA-binding CsgD family transcriptional regulator